MPTATKTRTRKPQLVLLREEAVVGFAALDQSQKRVDRDKGLIYGVKVVSRTSPNRHNVSGADSTEYTAAALKEALPLYEGLDVYIDHARKDAAGQVRACRDRFGKLINARIHEGEIYADLLYVKSHEMAEPICEAADDPLRNDFFALSHNAYGQGAVVNRVYRIDKIPRVESADVVTKGGTNRSLLESAEMSTKQIKLREACEKHAALKDKLADLLKLSPMFGEMLVQESEDGGEGDYRDHLHMAKKMCEDNEDYETAGKIHKLMAPGKGDKEEGGDGDGEEKKKPVEESGSDEIRGKNKEGQKRAMWAKDPENPYSESREAVKPPAAVLLQESLAKDLFAVSRVRETPALMKVVRESGTTEKALSILKAIQESGGSRSSPPTAPPGTGSAGGALSLKDIRRSLSGMGR